MISKPRLIVLAAIAAAALSLLPSAAGAATLGSRHIGVDTNAGSFCGGFDTCAEAQTKLPGAITRAPFDGTITRWRINLESPGTVELVVLRKRANQTFKAIEFSTPKTIATPGPAKFGARLKARKGELIGVDLLDGDVAVQTIDSPAGAFTDFFTPDFGTSPLQLPFAPFSGPSGELQLNATLKR